MFGFLKKLARKPAPETPCSRFGAARDPAWRRAWLKAQDANQPAIDYREGRK